MYYFVNQYILSQNSSVEHAEFARVKLFQQFETPAKIVTRDFDPVLHSTIKKFGLADDQVQNMFDFFAGTTDYTGEPLKFDALHLSTDYQFTTGNNFRTFSDGGRTVGEVHFAPGTVARVRNIDYFDVSGNLTLREQYDIRGFKTADEFFGQDGQMHYQALYRPDQTKYMERYYVKSTENTPINSLNRLINYQGHDYYFDTIDDLFTFFLDRLNNSTAEDNTFIADRPAMANNPVMDMMTPAKKLLWLPINHVAEGNDPVAGVLSGVYQQALSRDNIGRFDGLIVMTAQQKADLKKRFKRQIKIYQVSGGIAATGEPVPMAQRQPNRIIHVGRLGLDKQIDQVIQVFQGIHDQIPTATLTLYGYGEGADVAKFEEQVKNAGLEGLVTFAGYLPDTSSVYENAQLYLDCARIDGQPLSLVEALGHGVPALAYDYPYGPSDLITNGKNGYLIAPNTPTKMIQTAVKLLKNPARLQKMSDQAYELSRAVDAQHVWKQWQTVIKG